ncbi:uncharacterized protein LOC135157348 [Lytechinus pictus]|uniref:uncharacterized protein LOC135157348 n=1 Tax=Lytechinus pictus TaxID=7653 RepID=UPI0030B9F893
MQTSKEFTNKSNKMDISAILEKAAGGQSILGELEEGGPQSASNRRRMVRIVVSHLMEKYGNKPSADQKVGMAISMIQQFPALKDVEGPGYEAWYTPAVEGEHAKGFIEERLKNVRKRMPKQGWTSLEPSSSSEENQKEPSTKEKIEELKSKEKDMEPENLEEMKQWLQHNNSPIPKVVEFMKKTALKRQEEIHSEKKSTVHDIELQWPRLFDVPNMIDGDFRAVHGDVSDRLIMKWTQELAKKLLQYGEKQSPQVQADIDDQSAQDAGLTALPLILPTGKLSNAKKSRATVKEAMESFIDFQPIGTNLPQYLDGLMSKRRQPFVLAHRKRQHNILLWLKAVDVCFKLFYVLDLEAVDVCFKLFYVLDLEYPSACYTTWEFIQKVLYQVNAKDRNTSSCVRSLRTYVLHT